MKKILSKIAALHIALTALVWVGMQLGGLPLVASDFFWGSALSVTQMVLLIIIGYRVLFKKGIALTLILSVFKYGILLGLFILSIRGVLTVSTSFVVGFAIIVPSLMGLFFLRSFSERNGL